MSEKEARAALGPAINKMMGTRDKLPKTIEAASRMPEKSLYMVTNEALIASTNVQLLITQIIEVSDDPMITMLGRLWE